MQELKQLTDLYYDRMFFREADKFLQNIEPGRFALVAIDIEHFRMFNKLFGRDAGDCLLRRIAECVKAVEQSVEDSFVGYMGADNFCVIIPDEPEIVSDLKSEIDSALHEYKKEMDFRVLFGVYPIEDVTLPSDAMYDRAVSAIASDLINYRDCIYRYDPGAEERMAKELKLIAEVKLALENREFTFFAQPQCDIVTGKIVGAESLVRWNHPEKGWIPPGVFIPVLEKNGLIAELDRYVWREVCSWIRSWIDRGYNPVPFSVNVSRIDILSMDVPRYLIELVKEFKLPPKLLKVEITESAYAESNEFINKTVQELRDAGFVVMLDDFGSGYSSLNILNNIKVDVIKLDMRFLDIKEQEKDKGIGILGSVVSMARMLGLPIIVEGVETQEQEDYLSKLGCRYIQGYFYYRPLPIPQIEELMSDERKLDYEGVSYKQLEAMHVREFLDDNLFDDRMVNNMLGATAFYEVYNNQIEITRANEQYYQLTGITLNKDDNRKLWNHVRDDDRQMLRAVFETAYEDRENGASANLHYIRVDGKVLLVHVRIFFLREKDGKRIFYGSLTDMTSIKTEEDNKLVVQEVTELTEKQQNRLERYFGSLPYGYAVAKIMVDEANIPEDYEVVYINQKMGRLCGNKVELFRNLVLQVFKNDSKDFLEKAYKAAYLGETVDTYAYSPISNNYLQLTFYQYEYGYVSCILRDVTHTHMYEDALNTMITSYREVYFLHVQDNYCRMIYPEENSMLERGNYEEVVNRHFCMGKIVNHNVKEVRKFLALDNIKEELMKQDTVEFRYRRTAPDGSKEWCLTSITVSPRENGVPKTAIMMIRSIEGLLYEVNVRRLRRMAETLAHMEEGFFVYKATEDEELLYANPKVLQIFGCETLEEFRAYVNNSFGGIVHPDDLGRVRGEIAEQIATSDGNMDYIRYRIVRKDGEIRWVDDWGHLEKASFGEGNDVFYVFIYDITDTITPEQKRKLLNQNKHY